MEDQNAQLVIIPGTAIIRFKKLNNRLLPANNQTPRSRGFYSQDDIPGIPLLPKLISGIRVNQDWTMWDGLFLVFPKSALELNWALDISSDVNEIDQNQLTIDAFADDNYPEHIIRKPAGSEDSDEQEIQPGDAEFSA